MPTIHFRVFAPLVKSPPLNSTISRGSTGIRSPNPTMERTSVTKTKLTAGFRADEILIPPYFGPACCLASLQTSHEKKRVCREPPARRRYHASGSPAAFRATHSNSAHPTMILFLTLLPPVAAIGFSLIYLLLGGGLFGAVLIFIIAKMFGK